MFWDEKELVSKRHARIRMPPPIPETGWRPPSEFPNLSAAVEIAFDVETKEWDFDRGPGWARGKSHIAGLSIGARDRQGNTGGWYFPIRHEVEPHDNMDVASVLAFASHWLGQPHTLKVGANLTYDIGTLKAEGVNVRGPLYDVQFAEPLIDSEGRVALEVLGQKYLGEGKDTDLLYEWCREAYPNTPPTKWRGDIYRAPPRLVAPYAIQDSILPLRVMDAQQPILDEENLNQVFKLECGILPLIVDMRFAGIKVNLDRAAQFREELINENAELYKRIQHEYGYNLSSGDSRQVAHLFDHVGIKYPTTVVQNNKVNPSIEKEWLAGLEHPLGKLINDIREHEKIVGTFIDGYIFGNEINGRVHCEFHQLKGDENGTIVGRFSSSNFNLQNIPSRTKLGKRVRTCFEPDEGHHCYTKMDYSQIHYRILAHNAVGPGSDELRQSYIDNPKMDYHGKVYNEVGALLGWDLEDKELKDFRRRPIKNVNFGLLYGQSIKALKRKTAMYFGEGFSDKDTETFFKAYFDGAPYVKPTMEAIGREVQFFGYVTTLLGRRIRFNLFEPAKRNYDEYQPPLPYDEALREYGSPLIRAFEYRGVNYKFQGSEPDIMKMGMYKCLQSGVFDYTGVPRLTCHDELGFSRPDDSPQMKEAFDFIKHTMETAIPMRVPIIVDVDEGPNWGECG